MVTPEAGPDQDGYDRDDACGFVEPMSCQPSIARDQGMLGQEHTWHGLTDCRDRFAVG